jgi:hypothetical protein
LNWAGIESFFFMGFSDGIMSQVIQQEALTRLLIEKGVFTEGEFLEMMKEFGVKAKLYTLHKLINGSMVGHGTAVTD